MCARWHVRPTGCLGPERTRNACVLRLVFRSGPCPTPDPDLCLDRRAFGPRTPMRRRWTSPGCWRPSRPGPGEPGTPSQGPAKPRGHAGGAAGGGLGITDVPKGFRRMGVSGASARCTGASVWNGLLGTRDPSLRQPAQRDQASLATARIVDPTWRGS